MPYNISLGMAKREWLSLGKPLEEAETLGEALRIQIEKYDGMPEEISQSQVALDMNVHQGTLSKVQNDKSPGTAQRWTSDQIKALMAGYRITDPRQIQLLAYRFDLRLPRELMFDSAYQRFLSDPAAKSIEDYFPGAKQAVADGPQAMHMGIVSAGVDGKSRPSKPKLVNIPSWLAERYDPKDLFVVTVEGDSMTCEDVRKSITAGTDVYFHKTLQPDEGEIIAAWLDDRDIGVIKIYKPQRMTSVLESYNRQHAPILIDENNPGRVEGVYVGESKPSPRRFDNRKHRT